MSERLPRTSRTLTALAALTGFTRLGRPNAPDSRTRGPSSAASGARSARESQERLGHCLSAIAVQLELADALHRRGRHEEANAAGRRARALAVDGIAETRRAIDVLGEPAPTLDRI